MPWKTVLTLLCLLPPLFASAQQNKPDPSASKAKINARLEEIKKWRNFDGIWEGAVRYASAPKPEWASIEQPIRLIFNGANVKLYFKLDGGNEWIEVARSYRGWATDELTVVVHAYGAEGVWTEHHVVVITRDSEDSGRVYVQRVVNNWAGTPKQGEDLIYADSRYGFMKRIKKLANLLPQPTPASGRELALKKWTD